MYAAIIWHRDPSIDVYGKIEIKIINFILTVSDKPEVTVKNKNGYTETHNFDYVVLCSGANSKENLPQFPGQDSFEGKIIHSSDFSN